MTQTETVIVGGGPAGASAACCLAMAGRAAIVIERAAAPHHKVCGEFLSVETQEVLRRLGIEPEQHGAVAIEEVGLHSGTRSVSTTLPFRALSWSRYRLDCALLERAEAAGAEVRRGVAVLAVAQDGGRWSVRCDDEQTIVCRNLVVATGKQGLRGIMDSRDGSLVGLKMHLRIRDDVRRALERRVELFLLEGSYVGLELVEDGVANLCLVIERAIASRIGPGWPVLRERLVTLSPPLAERLEGATALFEKPLAVVCPAGGHIHAADAASAFRVGDRLAHIPPFTGDGLAIAVTSGALAADHIARDLSPAAYLAAARRLTAAPVILAGAISTLMRTPAGRAFLMGTAALIPGIVSMVARQTRLKPRALPMGSQDVSYAPVRAGTGDGISARSSAG